MKQIIEAFVLLTLSVQLSACGSSRLPISSPTTIIETSAATALPFQTVTPVEPKSIEDYIRPGLAPTIPAASSLPTIEFNTNPAPIKDSPTLLPTFDPTSIPEILNKAFSIQKLEGLNGYSVRQITGWKYGFLQGVMVINGWVQITYTCIHEPWNGSIFIRTDRDAVDRLVRLRGQDNRQPEQHTQCPPHHGGKA